jgi:hypothetical protein
LLNRITEELRVIQTLCELEVLAHDAVFSRFLPFFLNSFPGASFQISPHIDSGMECSLGRLLLLSRGIHGGQSLARSLARGADLLAFGTHGGEYSSLVGEKLSEFKGPGPGQASLAKGGGSHEG